MYLARAFLVWLAIILAESIHGTFRQMFLAPLIGDFPARRIAFFVGMLLIFVFAYFFVRWIRAEVFAAYSRAVYPAQFFLAAAALAIFCGG